MAKTIDITSLDKLQANWNYPASIRFGAGRIAELADVCQQLQITRPLLVTDGGLVKLPFVSEIVESSRAADLAITVFSDVKPNPTGTNVDSGVKSFTKANMMV